MLADLTEAVETRHPWTRGHAHRVAALAAAVGQSLGWDDQTLSDIRAGSLLHDIGKLSIPGEILAKPGPLNAVEQAEVRRHPAAGALLVANLPKARRALPSILHHHERWDGRGYPAGIAGSDIPAEARLVALADAYDAMTSHRPYRATLTIPEALDELTRCAGTQFDPILTHACVEVWAARLRLAV
jgi:HD-GYP domain-containing protein (c-di-GMP phosphodiesterase class II)